MALMIYRLEHDPRGYGRVKVTREILRKIAKFNRTRIISIIHKLRAGESVRCASYRYLWADGG